MIFIGLSISGAKAQLAFQADVKEFHPDIDTKEIKVAFPFVNVGSTPVTIKSIQPSCGCTVAASDKVTYAPGEKGVINAVYTIHGATGFQEKELAVTTVEDPDSIKVLTIKAYIPALVSFSPNVLRWTVGDALASKAVSINLLSQQAVKLIGVDCNTDQMMIKLHTLKQDDHYEISVTPVSTNEAISGIVMVRLLLPTNLPRVAYYHVSVEPRPAP